MTKLVRAVRAVLDAGANLPFQTKMMLVRACRTFAILLACAAGVPSSAFAQAIAGVVHDASGAALPGVAVQAESSALIERVRTVVTDGSGQYRIEGLRPGSYTVTFRRAGFGPYVRDGVEITSAFTASVNAQLAPGAVAETITVTAPALTVDVRSAAAATTLRDDLVRALPTVRSYNALVVLVPGVTTSGNDVVTGTATTAFPIHGGRGNEGRLTLDGLTVGSPPSGNSATSYVVDAGATEEVTFATASGAGRERNRRTRHEHRAEDRRQRHPRLVSSRAAPARSSSPDNLTPALKQQGVTAADPAHQGLRRLGHARRTDRAGSSVVLRHRAPGRQHDRTARTSTTTSTPATRRSGSMRPTSSRREYSDRTFENASGRLTWQVTPRNKVSVFWDEQALCRTCTGATSGLSEPRAVSPEAVGVLGRPLRVTQATWSSPVTNRLLVDAGYGGDVLRRRQLRARRRIRRAI